MPRPKKAKQPVKTNKQVQQVLPGTERSSRLVFSTMKQAAAHSGLSTAQLKALRDNGAPGFRNSRIFWDEVEAYLKDSGQTVEEFGASVQVDESKEGLQIRKLKEECEKLRIQNAVLRGDYVHRRDVAALVTLLAQGVKDIHIRNEQNLPPLLSGLEVPAIREFFKNTTAEVCKAMAPLIEAWSPEG